MAHSLVFRSPASLMFWLAALLLGAMIPSPLHAQMAYFSGSVTTLNGGFSYPTGVTIDRNGNIYVLDGGATVVKEMPFGCASSACVTTLGGGFNGPTGIAVDTSGNVYVADSYNYAVKKVPAGCTSSACVTTLGGGFNLVIGVAVDASGNVYVGDSGHQMVKEIPSGCLSSACVLALGGGFASPYGVAVDVSGNVYVADSPNSAVDQIPPGCVSSTCVTSLGGGFQSPAGVAVDGSGNIYVADTYHHAVKEMPSGLRFLRLCHHPGRRLQLSLRRCRGPGVEAAERLCCRHRRNKDHAARVNLGTVAVGSATSPATLYFTFSTSGSGITASVLTQGATGLDFADAGTGTCDTNGNTHTYNSGDSFTVNVTFAPKYAGQRYGAVNLSSAGGVSPPPTSTAPARDRNSSSPAIKPSRPWAPVPSSCPTALPWTGVGPSMLPVMTPMQL